MQIATLVQIAGNSSLLTRSLPAYYLVRARNAGSTCNISAVEYTFTLKLGTLVLGREGVPHKKNEHDRFTQTVTAA